MKSHLRFMHLLFILSLFSSCGGTTEGNPAGRVTLESDSYNNTGVLKMASIVPIDPSLTFMAPVTDFRFCITQLQLKDESNSSVGGASIEARLGLVDVSNTSATTTWGELEIPIDFTLSLMTVELHKDAETCSSETFSISYNSATVDADFEFKFRFDPAVVVDDGSVFTLGLTSIATAIENADQASSFTNESLGAYLEAVEGTGEKN